PYADGSVLGFALVAPRGSDILRDRGFLQALRAVAPLDEALGRHVMYVHRASRSADAHFSVGLSPTVEPPRNRRSLDPSLYTKPARAFASVTPLVLDRHLKTNGET